jgi:hypothetical protein
MPKRLIRFNADSQASGRTRVKRHDEEIAARLSGMETDPASHQDSSALQFLGANRYTPPAAALKGT